LRPNFCKEHCIAHLPQRVRRQRKPCVRCGPQHAVALQHPQPAARHRVRRGADPQHLAPRWIKIKQDGVRRQRAAHHQRDLPGQPGVELRRPLADSASRGGG